MIYDYIVVGSGASGSQAAQTLVESGANVVMLDVGVKDDYYKNKIPDKDFINIRTVETNQHEYFLGKNFEGVPWGHNRVGSQLTPPRNFISKHTHHLTPFLSDSLFPMESLALGGLAAGWGCGSYVFSDSELTATGLDKNEMKDAYKTITSRIGISAEQDDGKIYSLLNEYTYQAAPALEKGMEGINRSYLKQRNKLNAKGIFMGRTPLALLTEDLGERRKTSLHDMDFWSDAGKSAYRPSITVEELLKKQNFSYYANRMVIKFIEKDEQVEVVVKRTDTNEEEIFYCKRLVLCSGTFGTARIVIRSFDYKTESLPVISNPYTYIPCIQWRMLGRGVEQLKTGFSQMMIYFDEKKNNSDVTTAALFSYRSLLLFKLIKELPLNFKDARIIMQYLQSSFIIAGLHYPENPSKDKFIRLEKDHRSYTGDKLTAQYLLSEEEKALNKKREAVIKQTLNSLGCFPLRSFHTPHGASIHYAGALPFSENGQPFTLSKNGKLSQTKNVFIADGSGFKYLPAKGLTLTLMANAHRIAQNLTRQHG